MGRKKKFKAVDSLDMPPEGTKYLQEELRSLRQGVYSEEIQRLTARENFPKNQRPPEWKKSWKFTMFERTGQAEIQTEASEDPPLMGVNRKETEVNIHRITAAYEIDLDDVQKSNELDLGLSDELALAAKEAIAIKKNHIALFGDPVHDMFGLVTAPNIVRHYFADPIADGTPGSDIISQFGSFLNRAWNDTGQRAMIDTVMLASKPFGYMRKNFRSTDSDLKLLEAVRPDDVTEEEFNMIPSHELNAAGPNGDFHVVIGWDSTKEPFKEVDPKTFTQQDPQRENYALRTNTDAKTGGVEVPWPAWITIGLIPVKQ